MSEYIERDALLEIIDHYILHDEDARKHHSASFVEGMKDGYYRLRSQVVNMPSADVVPGEKYRRLLKDAKILSDSFDEYLRRTGE